VTFTPLTDPLRRLLNLLAGTTGAATNSLNPDGLAQARRFGWVYEYQGRAASTGAGAVLSTFLLPSGAFASCRGPGVAGQRERRV
jgi:hypothetical protein